MDQRFVVTYTRHKTKKSKTYQDGELKLVRQGLAWKAILFDDGGTMLQEMSVKDVGSISEDNDIEFPGFLVRVDSEVQCAINNCSTGRPSACESSIPSQTRKNFAKRPAFTNPRRKDVNLEIQISSQPHMAKPPECRRASDILSLLRGPRTINRGDDKVSSPLNRNEADSAQTPVVHRATSEMRLGSAQYAAGPLKSTWVPLHHSVHLVKSSANKQQGSKIVQSRKFVTPRPLTKGVETTAGLGKRSIPGGTAQDRTIPGRSNPGLFVFVGDSNPPQSRQKAIADSYLQFLDYKCALMEALIEEINLQIGQLARSFFDGRKEALLVVDTRTPCCKHGPAQLRFVGKEGPNKGRPFYSCPDKNQDKCLFQWADQKSQQSRNENVIDEGTPDLDPAVLASALRSRGVFFHQDVQLSQKPCSFSNKRKAYDEVEPSKPAVFQLQIDKVAKAGKMKEEFSIDDIWVVSSNPRFTCHERMDFVAVATSTFHGPSSTGHVEVKFHGQKPPADMDQPVFALHGASIQTELAMLETVKSLQPSSFPLLPLMWKAPAGPDTSGDAPSKGGEAAMLALRTVERFRLNEDQAAVLRRCASWYDRDQLTGDSRKAFNPALCLVHGTFGSGKSTLLVALIFFLVELFEMTNDTTSRILVSAATNVAVDRILLGLLKHGFNRFVRVGSRNFAPALKEYTLHNDTEEEKEIMDERKSLRKEEGVALGGRRVREEIKELDAKLRVARRKRLEDALVVGVTCFSSSHDVLKGMTYKVCLLDECSQMPEPLSLMPLAILGCEKLVAVGDPAQLPPQLTGSSSASKEDDIEAGLQKSGSGHGLERAMFVRLAEIGHTPIMLRTQYRCHPLVSALPNKLFYAGRLLDGCSAADRAALVAGLPALLFLDTRQEAQEARDASSSYYNDYEANLAARMVNKLIDKGCRPGQIGVIVPYRAQASKLNSLLSELQSGTQPKKRRRKAALEDEDQLSDFVQVSTVDAFQGMEKDIIILSCCRTNGIGFLASPHRLNVAMSRARNHLLIIGCAPNLQTCPMWKELLTCIRRTPLAYRPASAPLPGLEVPPVLPQPQLLPPPSEPKPSASPEPVLASPTGRPSPQDGPFLGPLEKRHGVEAATQQLMSLPASRASETPAGSCEAASSTIFDFLGPRGQGSLAEALAEEAAVHEAAVRTGQGEGTGARRQPEKCSRPEESSSASLDDSDIESPSGRETEVDGDRPSLDLCSRAMEDALDAANFGLQDYWIGYSRYRLSTFDSTAAHRQAFLDSKMCRVLGSAFGVATDRWRPNLGKLVREARIMMEDYLESRHGEGCTAVRRLIPQFEDVDELKKTEFGRRLIEESLDEEAAEASAAGVIRSVHPSAKIVPAQGSFAKALGELKARLDVEPSSRIGRDGSGQSSSDSDDSDRSPEGLLRIRKRARLQREADFDAPSFDLGID
ncbi:RNA helicase nonsense mRNA reducing factor [Klebsormidium nitens]|uniref:RNA helicase nonsense mRNA reducing factor n=1 Tax=Klebsormidium nitens TaxID=105231 RepID=A0A1Y1II62_KLENI|nr:RNA helicase nonsense mRNA reducing factor [Klebsormidium nitens]|eukprot:GAQ88406.1 RNA helicase nonsense mRNA reducing factor [Klebsormidium nitens]